MCDTLQFTKEELIEIVQKIMDCDGTEEEIDALICLLEENMADPKVSDYIFYPEDGQELSAIAIIEKALAYQPMITPVSGEMNTIESPSHESSTD